LDAGQHIKQMLPSVKLVYHTMSQDAGMAAEAFRHEGIEGRGEEWMV